VTFYDDFLVVKVGCVDNDSEVGIAMAGDRTTEGISARSNQGVVVEWGGTQGERAMGFGGATHASQSLEAAGANGPDGSGGDGGGGVGNLVLVELGLVGVGIDDGLFFVTDTNLGCGNSLGGIEIDSGEGALVAGAAGVEEIQTYDSAGDHGELW
jgi:hypothetical protein